MNNRRMSDAGLDYQGRYADPMWRPTRAEKVFAIAAIVICTLLCVVGLVVR